jgi:ATP-dependent helicase/nuclease subunit B
VSADRVYDPSMSRRLVRASAAERRIAFAREWLEARSPGEELLVVAASADAANELLRTQALARGAAFGWHRATLPQLATRFAEPALALAGAVPVGRLALQAVVARVLHGLAEQGGLDRFARAADGPGLARAAASALEELRLANAGPAAVEKESSELRALLDAFIAELRAAGLADRARVLSLATESVRSGAAHPWLGLPTLLLDVPVGTALERGLVSALAARAPDVAATLPRGDRPGELALEAALEVRAEDLAPGAAGGALGALQSHLFEGTAPAARSLDDEIVVLSAPGESRECVEMARRIHGLARSGVPFDRIAVLLRSPEEYRPHLVEAFGRAGIPAHFARGAVRPDPSGRAFCALLSCAGEGLSARAFAEYLSLGELPDAEDGAPPPAAPSGERWVAPDVEGVSPAIAAAPAAPAPRDDGVGRADGPDRADAAGAAARADEAAAARATDAPVAAGSLRAPRHWERLIVDAAVIGGRERWERRLDGLARELSLDAAALDDPDDPLRERLRRDLDGLARLRAFAFPLLDALSALPARATWGAWLDALAALATRALRRPDRVLSVLAELAPMAEVGPVELAEVQLVLSGRLLEVADPPPDSRYGRVFVAPVEAARGLAFDVVFVPGLAERLFPRKIGEEPILLDDARRRLDADLATREERVAAERLALRLAVGAARRSLVLSYPRLDLDQSRPRVPSFYALEALRAATGALPGFDELAQQAEGVTQARVGWPAPASPEAAIDEAEHDLALLESLLAKGEERSIGTARYLLTANAHLGRALRFRARRWLPNWTQADGLVPPLRGEVAAGAREAIAAHALTARSFSPTALQNFAVCPYKFFLYAVHRLAPREVPEAIEEIDPLQRGSMVHDVQFELFGTLRDAGLLPVTSERLPAARDHLDRVLDEVAERYRDELAPAIERVWRDGVESVRADLREWLRRASEDATGFIPWRFELSFGLPGRRAADPHSRDAPVALDAGIALRGSIDLVERREDGRLRATDHKTGKVRVKVDEVVSGGEALQPVLYALALEKLFPDDTVDSGRLYYCTGAGGFAERTVLLDADARESAATVAGAIGEALATPFLPAAPSKGACRWCDYRVVCGPYEELRTDRKWAKAPGLAGLRRVRELR